MADDDSSKDQLAFVSGYVLVFGFVALKLWPLAAGFQTGMTVNFWTTDPPSEGVIVPLNAFWSLACALGIALTAAMLAICHILCYGLRLLLRSIGTGNQLVYDICRHLDRLPRITFQAIFSLLFVVGAYLVFFPLNMIRAWIEGKLVSSLSLSLHAAGWISLLTFLPFLIAAWLALRFLALPKLAPYIVPALTKYENLRPFPRIVAINKAIFKASISFFAPLILTTAIIALVIQTCYTAEISPVGSVFQRSRNDVIEVEMTLGGSSSALNLAQFKLTDSRGVPVGDLSPQDLGGGHYLFIIRSQNLQADRYQVTLEYPHSSLDSSFPFLHQRIVTRRWFLVTP
jgi:hypothetical protein